MRIVFMGSPEFALPTLSRLIESQHDVVAVYTQPDRPSGRGRRAAPPAVKTLALEHGLEVRQPPSISAAESVDELHALRPDLGVIAAYGQILRQRVLDVPTLGILNVHASLLPRWRGAAPIPAAILAGDREAGATIMQVVRALDAGPMLGATSVGLSDSETTATLTPRIAEAGARLLMELLPGWASGSIQATPQDESLATYAPQIEKADALIDWGADDAVRAWRKVRAYNPWPVAFAQLDGAPLRILEGAVSGERSEQAPGTAIETPTGFGVVAADGGILNLVTVQPPGKQAMGAAAFLRGRRDVIGRVLGAR